MAQRIHTVLIDDLDPHREAAETVAFGLEGSSYEIDLSADHVGEMRAALAPFVTAARKVGGSTGARRGRRATGAGADPTKSGITAPNQAAVRAWAKEHDMTVSNRGRVSGTVVAQFLEATS